MDGTRISVVHATDSATSREKMGVKVNINKCRQFFNQISQIEQAITSYPSNLLREEKKIGKKNNHPPDIESRHEPKKKGHSVEIGVRESVMESQKWSL